MMHQDNDLHVYQPDEVLTAEELQKKETKKTPGKGVFTAWALMVTAIAYTFLPIDLVPDVPVVGWLDDMLFILGTALNLTEKYAERQQPFVAKIICYIKWIAIFLALFILLVTLMLGAVVWHIFFH